MKCLFCKEQKDVPAYDNVAEHLIIVMDIKGSCHVHGPFSNEYVIRKMADALLAEMEKNGVKYMPATQHNIGD
jgi:hypothetical protein